MPAATRFVTLSFDDGFRTSSVRTAELYERFGLRAEFHVVATYGLRDPVTFGDWALWNDLAARGHVIHPHGYDHTNKTSLPTERAQDSILQCLEEFQAHLHGFDPAQAIFAFPYNASTPELEAWLPTVVRAFRTGHTALNPLPSAGTVRLTTGGWEDAEPWLDRCTEDLLALNEGWLIYCAHGLDGEGWGPLRHDYLERLLERLVATENLEILPARDILRRFDAAPEA
ncbi:MAG: polysaccharide deacetylase family protein [Capsulimonadales bacterium]|nr:polysaccharide deacetylase family protein [Capsulimonadales bacterium]